MRFSRAMKRSRRQAELEENAETPKLDGGGVWARLDAERRGDRGREFAATLDRGRGRRGAISPWPLSPSEDF